MAYALGVILFALGIFVSVCLHEAGHMGTAKAFGMKVTRYFAGFGPTLWSFQRGETEYGLKAVPLGGFVKIVGMTPLEEEEEDLSEADKKRVMWRKPLWQRTIVLSAGSVTHFIIAFVILWITAMFVGLPNPALAKAIENAPKTTVVSVLPCVATKAAPTCVGDSPASPAKTAGLLDRDEITEVNGKPVATYDDLRRAIRPLQSGPVTLTVVRDGAARPVVVEPVVIDSPSLTDASKLEKAAAIGITQYVDPNLPRTVTYGPADSISEAGSYYGTIVTGTFGALKKFPEKIPKLWTAITGGERDVETPISVVGASRLGGEAAERGIWPFFFLMLASLNIFVGIFNLLPLLPLDGGHIAIAWYEKVRSWFAAKRGKPDPGRVDYLKLMPVTYVVIAVFGVFTLLTVGADIVNPIILPK